MAARISLGSFRVGKGQIQGPKRMTSVTPIWQLSPSIRKLSRSFIAPRLGRNQKLSICFAVKESESPEAAAQVEESTQDIEKHITASYTDTGGNRAEKRMARKKTERFTYLVAAVMSSFGITSMAVFAVYSRFVWQMEVYILYMHSCILFDFLSASQR